MPEQSVGASDASDHVWTFEAKISWDDFLHLLHDEVYQEQPKSLPVLRARTCVLPHAHTISGSGVGGWGLGFTVCPSRRTHGRRFRRRQVIAHASCICTYECTAPYAGGRCSFAVRGSNDWRRQYREWFCRCPPLLMEGRACARALSAHACLRVVVRALKRTSSGQGYQCTHADHRRAAPLERPRVSVFQGLGFGV